MFSIRNTAFTKVYKSFNGTVFYNVRHNGKLYLVKRISERAFHIFHDGIFLDEVTTFDEVTMWLEENR